MLRFRQRSKQVKFEKLTKPHLDALYRTARRMTGEIEAAEDLVQETCLKAFRAFTRWNPGTNYKAWLFKVMTNTHIDKLRCRPDLKIVELEASHQDEQAFESWFNRSALDPEQSFAHDRFLEMTVHAIESLNPEIRYVVMLALVEEFSYEEIAQIMNIPIGTVRSRLNRGRKQLRERLCEYETSKPAPVITLSASKRAAIDG